MSATRRPGRWFAIGDPQTSFEKLRAVLDHHGLLAGDRLRPEVGLVSMGDHFDYGGGGTIDDDERREAGRQGCRTLDWLAGHPPEQVRILVGNHDLARVQELACVDDATFVEARREAVALRRSASRGAAQSRFHERFPMIPTPGLADRDFSTFLDQQRTLVQRLLVEGRFDCALRGRLGDRPCLITHAGVTTRELRLLGLREDARPEAIAAELSAFLRERVERVTDAWSRGELEPLDLAPLHHAGVCPREAGGMFAHRPANPDRPNVKDREWEWDASLPRRFDPRTLPAGLLQIVGHTQHRKLVPELDPWVADDGRRATGHELRSLEVHGDLVRYGPGIPGGSDGSRMVFTDARLHEAPVDEVELLALEDVAG